MRRVAGVFDPPGLHGLFPCNKIILLGESGGIKVFDLRMYFANQNPWQMEGKVNETNAFTAVTINQQLAIAEISLSFLEIDRKLSSSRGNPIEPESNRRLGKYSIIRYFSRIFESK